MLPSCIALSHIDELSPSTARSMSAGFYTKHFDGDRVYYFNAEKNVSVWTAPVDCTVHEAPNAKANATKTAEEGASEATVEEGVCDTAVVSTAIPVETCIDNQASNEREEKRARTVEVSSLDDMLSSIKEQAVSRVNPKRFKSSKEEEQDAGESSEYSKLVSSFKQASGGVTDEMVNLTAR